MEARRLIVWSCYRSLSSALSRAFLQRRDTHVSFEPFSGAFYLSSDRVHTRHADVPDLCQGYAGVWAELLAHRAELVVCKDFPLCLPASRWSSAPLERFQHVFLIRHPRKSLASMLKEAGNRDNAEYEVFDPSEAGYSELARFYRHITETRLLPATVIESDELGAEPEAGLRALCRAVGIQFDDAMLEWRPEAKLTIQWNGWAPFYDRVQRARGFEPNASPMPAALPEGVERAAVEALPFYETLAPYRLRFGEQIKFQ